MRALTASQWARHSALVAQLAPLAPAQRAAALQARRAQGVDDPTVLSLVALHFALPPDPERDRRGEQVGRFTLGALLAAGGMGVVYRATDDMGRAVAVKLIHPAFLVTEHEEAVGRFSQEIALLARLDHSGIATIYDGGLHDDPTTGEVYPFFAMQLVRGGRPLTTYATEHAFTLPARLGLFLEVCQAVHYAHTQGIIHRDLKPANILVDGAGYPCVIDFGLAHAWDAAVPGAARLALAGTPAYMSPEHVTPAFGPIGPASDVYALGIVLYELLAGQRPYAVPAVSSAAALAHAIVAATPVPLHQRNAACHGPLDTIVGTALAKRPAARYPSVAAFQEALAPALQAAALAAPGLIETLGPFYVADHRLVLTVTRGPTGQASLRAATAAADLAGATLRFTLGAEQGVLRLAPSATAPEVWSALHPLDHAFATVRPLAPTCTLEVSRPELRMVTALLVTWTETAPPATPAVPLPPPQHTPYWHCVTETVRRYGGYSVPGRVETEILVVFGVLHTPEQAATQAIEVALALRQTLAARPGAVTFGLASGRAAVTPSPVAVHAPDLWHQVRQVQACARPGEIRVDTHTQAAARQAFRFQPGRAVAAGLPTAVVLTQQPPAHASVLIGREEEWATLQGWMAHVCAGTGLFVALLGEAGIGKSRLLADMRHHLADRVAWLEGHARSAQHIHSYGPFGDMLQNAAGITEADDARQAALKLATRFQTLLPDDWDELQPALLRLMVGRDSARGTYARPSLAPDALGRQLFRAAFRFFAHLARVRPLVLVFENWQWRDQASAALLDHLTPLLQQQPVLLCVVSRPESLALLSQWRQRYAERFRHLTLAPLSARASTQLLDTLLPPPAVAPALRATLLHRAAGNPFFLQELVLASTQQDVPASWTSPALPATIEAHILARVALLPEPLKVLLRLAAVIGPRGSVALLHAAAPMRSEDVAAAMTTLQEFHFIAWQQPADHAYTFQHDLIQEALYHSLVDEDRRALHYEVGAGIERVFAHRLEAFASHLAYHYAQAAVWDKAKAYVLQAGDQAHEVAADAEALRLYEQVLPLIDDQLERPQWVSLQRKMGEALYRRGAYPQAVALLQHALATVGQPLVPADWQLTLAVGRQLLAQVRHRLLPPRRHGRMAAADVAVAAEQGRIYEILSWIDYFTGRGTHVLLDVLLMLNVAERSGLVPDMARGAAAVGLIGDLLPVFWLAGGYHRRAVRLAEQAQQPLTLAVVYFCLAYHEECQGHWARALAHYQHAAARYRAAGDLRGWAAATTSITRLSNYQGNFTQGLAVSELVIPVGQEGGDQQVWGWGLMEKGWLLWRLGAWDEAERHLQHARALFQALPDYQTFVWTNGVLGQCYVRQGKVPEALAVLETSQRLSSTLGVRGLHHLELLKGLADAYLAVAEHAVGPERSTALRQAKRACAALRRVGTSYRGGLPYAYRVQGTYVWLRGQRARAQQWWRRSCRMAEALGARWELGMTHLEMGTRLGDLAHLARAVTILTALGATADAAQGRALLQRTREASGGVGPGPTGAHTG